MNTKRSTQNKVIELLKEPVYTYLSSWECLHEGRMPAPHRKKRTCCVHIFASGGMPRS